MSSLHEIKLAAIELNTGVREAYKRFKEAEEEEKQKIDQIASLNEDMQIQDSSLVIMKEIIDKISEEHINRVVEMLRFAMQTIFYDKNYSIDIELGDKRTNKQAEFWLIETRPDGEVIRASFDDGIGGGILAVVGFVLQIFYIGYFKQSKVLFCDEAFSQVSDQYIESLMEFIKQLSTKKGYIFVLISHDPRLNVYADYIYQVLDGNIMEAKVLAGESYDS